jgi:HK97 family phage portal protein
MAGFSLFESLLRRGASRTVDDRERLLESISSRSSVGIKLAPWQDREARYPAATYQNAVVEGYLKNELINAGLIKIIDCYAQARLALYEGPPDTAPEIRRHKLLNVIRRPNPVQTEVDLWEWTLTDLYLSGNAFWEKQRNPFGDLIRINRLEPDRIGLIPGEAGIAATYVYEVGGQWYPINPKDILHWKFHHPTDRYFGLGRVVAALRAVATDNEMTDFAKVTLQNYAIPGVAIEAEQPVDPKVADELVREFEERYGKNRRGKPIVLQKGMKIHTIGMSLEELAFVDLRGVSETRVLMSLGGAALVYLLGTSAGMQRAIYNNYSEAREALADEIVSPLWNRAAATIRQFLLPEFDKAGRIEVAFDTSRVVAFENRRWSRLTTAVEGAKAGVLTRHQAARMAGLKPIGPDLILLPVQSDRFTVTDDGAFERFALDDDEVDDQTTATAGAEDDDGADPATEDQDGPEGTDLTPRKE